MEVASVVNKSKDEEQEEEEVTEEEEESEDGEGKQEQRRLDHMANQEADSCMEEIADMLKQTASHKQTHPLEKTEPKTSESDML